MTLKELQSVSTKQFLVHQSHKTRFVLGFIDQKLPACTLVPTYMDSDFFGVEVGMTPLFGMVFTLVLCDGSRPSYRHVVGVEGSINDQLTVIHQTGIVDC